VRRDGRHLRLMCRRNTGRRSKPRWTNPEIEL
jgi:hypothetical protein